MKRNASTASAQPPTPKRAASAAHATSRERAENGAERSANPGPAGASRRRATGGAVGNSDASGKHQTGATNSAGNSANPGHTATSRRRAAGSKDTSGGATDRIGAMDIMDTMDIPGSAGDAAGTIPASGSCTLVGAGPGDPELLTLKALRAIRAATVLLVDDLVSDAIVAQAAPGARIVHVGKRGGCKSTPQAFIEKLMLTAVRAGERVVRLKGGDPFIFGRGGEEAEHLRAAGVAVAVLNGITAGLAAATTLGAPLTHRAHAHGVLLVTGHARPGERQTDWPRLAATARSAKLTLVIYMGISRAATIEKGLLSGLPANTPVAIIEQATLPHQRHALTTLGALHATITHTGLTSPAVIVVGDVLRGTALAAQHAAQQDALRRAG